MTRRDGCSATQQRRHRSRHLYTMLILLLLMTTVTARSHGSVDNDATSTFLRRKLGQDKEEPAPSATPTASSTAKPAASAPDTPKPSSATSTTPIEDGDLISVALEPFLVEVGGTSAIERNMLLKATAQYLLDYFAVELENTHAVELGEAAGQRQFTRTFLYVGKAVFRSKAAPENFVVAVQRLALSDMTGFQEALNQAFGGPDQAPTLVSTKLLNDDDESGGGNTGSSSDGDGDSTNVGLIVGVSVAVCLVLLIIGWFVWKRFRKPFKSSTPSRGDQNKDGFMEDHTKIVADTPTPVSSATRNVTDEEESTGVEMEFDVDAYSLASYSLTDITPAKPKTERISSSSSKRKSHKSYRDMATGRGESDNNSDADDTISAFSYGNVGSGESTIHSPSIMGDDDDDDEEIISKSSRRWSVSPKKKKSSAVPRLLTTSYVPTTSAAASVGEVPWDEIVVKPTNDAHASQEVELVAPPPSMIATKSNGSSNGHYAQPPPSMNRSNGGSATRSTKTPSYRNHDEDLSSFLRERRRAKQSLRQKREMRRQPPAEMEV